MKAILGIDIAKSKFDVALLIEGKFKHKVFQNNAVGFALLCEWMKSKNVKQVHACMEATGIYGDALATFLYEAGHIVSVVNPSKIKGSSQSELSRNKTDKADAKIIAKFCNEKNPPAWQPDPEPIKALQALVKRYDDLTAIKQEEQNRLESAGQEVIELIKESIESLEKQRADVKNRIQKHILANSSLKTNYDLLLSITGIGEITAPAILAFLGDVRKFGNVRKLVAFIGLNPRKRESGSSVRGKAHVSKIGNTRLRSLFYFPAIVAKNHNPIIRAFCERLAKTGKHKMVIICAAMRKLVHIIYGVLKSGKPFNPLTRALLQKI